jgi:PhoH-like ATPase
MPGGDDFIGISSVVEDGYESVQCILVEHPEHLYVTDNYIVTHNTKEEKLDPWLAPIKDNLNVLSGGGKSIKKRGSNEKDWSYMDRFFEDGTIEMEAISYLRGRSLPNCIFIVDEVQNTNLHEIKTILTRMGVGSKIILTGDIDQIDNNKVDKFTNGLYHIIEKFKSYPIAGHVTLIKGERSELAALAAQIL